MKQSIFKFSKPIVEKLIYNVKENCNTANLKGKAIPLAFNTDIFMSEDDRKATVVLNIKAEDIDDFPFEFSIEMSSRVKWDKEVSEAMLDSILNKNVPAMILSYARPIISMITSHSDYKPLDLPFIDLRDSSSDKKE